MFGSDGSPIVQYVVIFAVIFTALAAIVFVVRRLTGRGLALPGRAGARGRQPRLGIVDVYELDRARQLILLRRDNVEHLLLVGGPNDVVVERNIQRGQRPMPEASLRPAEAAAEPLPDPLAEAGRLPEPQRALAEIGAHRPEPAFDPGQGIPFAMPVVVRPPIPGSGAAPPVTLPLDAGLLGGDEPGQEIPAERRPPAPERAPAPPERAEKPPREPFSPRRILQRTAPPLVDAKPEPASERARGEADRPAAAAPRMPPPLPPQLPPLAASAERRPVDPAVLSDMARQLQAALARPASAVVPAPAPPEPPPAPADDLVQAAPVQAAPVQLAPVKADPVTVDPVAAAMASAPAPAEPPPPEPPVAAPVPPPRAIPVPPPRPAVAPDAAELPRPVPPRAPPRPP
ncbi:flagellar biosynthetic protein FliO, partial [Methylobacterium sp. NEAU 140]|uniref:flagellar biosynthetic protein FliO n=1 Tax=Methylobacterium sp. NEAU 140 TaxID=3064945 RepID=UPI00273483B2